MTVQTLPPWMQHIEDNLTDMQKMVRQFIMTRPACSIMVDMGGGKTLCTLSALSFITPPNTHILVVAPKAIAVNTWTSEIRDWNIPLNVVSLAVNDKGKKLSKDERYARYKKLADGEYPPSMVIIGESLFADLVKFFGDNWVFPTLVIDEAQGFRNHKAIKFKALIKVRRYISRVIELTGTPMPNGIENLWSQMFILDAGSALGHNITTFRNRFCYTIPINENANRYEARPGALQEAMTAVQHLALASYNSELPMPERFDVDHYVSITDEDAADDYQQLAVHQTIQAILGFADAHNQPQHNDEATLVDTQPAVQTQQAPTQPTITPGMIITAMEATEDDGLGITAANAAVLRMKLLQMSSGTVYLDDVDTAIYGEIDTNAVVNLDTSPHTVLRHRSLFTVGNRIAMNIHNEKIDQLIEIIRDADSPVLVAYTFRSDMVKIKHCLTQAGIDVRVFDKTPEMYALWNAGGIPVMLIHPASAGHGLNLQRGGHHFVWYSLPDNLEHYLQANARLYRPGQQHDVYIHRIICDNTKDTQQPDRLIGKQIEQDTLLEGLHHDPRSISLNHDENYRQALITTAINKAKYRTKNNVTDRHDKRLEIINQALMNRFGNDYLTDDATMTDESDKTHPIW